MRAKMKNRFVKIAKALTAGLVLAAGLLGCSLDASDSSSGEKKAYLSVSNNSISRMIGPDSDVSENNIAKAELVYVKTGSGDAEQVAKTWETDLTDTALSLMLSDSKLYVQPGTYDFTLNLYTSSLNFTSHPPILCQSGTIKAKKVGEGVNKLEFSTTYAEDGTGDLSVSLYWNSGSGIEYVKARLFEMEDDLSLDKGTSIHYEKIYDEEENPFPQNQATYEVEGLKQGYYGLFVELYDKDDFLLNSLPYTVRIISGCISSANYTLDGINKRYALTFVNNKYAEWTGSNPNRKYNENTIITLPTENDISLEGYYFLGWNTEPNGSGKSYTPGSEIQLTDDLTLYSVWTDQVCTVTFMDGTNVFTKTVPKFVPFSVPEDELSKPLSAYDCWLLGTEEYDFTKPVTSDLTLLAVYNFEEQEGSEENPYLIESLSDYYTFVRTVNSGLNYYEGKYLKFTNDIGSDQMPVEFAVGTKEKDECFKGTLDGNGKKLTVKLSSDENYFATFRGANNATFKNLTLAGSITTSESNCAGLVSLTYGTLNIQNCIIEASLKNTDTSTWPDFGGFVSSTYSCDSITFENCAFTGKFTSTTTQGRGKALFVPNPNSNISSKFINCLAAPSEISGNFNGTYNNSFSNYGSFINCYYVTRVGNSQGVQVYETAGNGIYKPVTLCDGKIYYLETTCTGNFDADWTGNEISPDCTIKITTPKADTTGTQTYTLQEGTDYVIRYNKESGAPVPAMVDSGMYTLTFTGKGDFTGSFKTAFYVKKPLEGSGTDGDPYLINDAADWKTFGENVAAGTELYSGKYVRLMADIGTAECPVTTMVGGNSEAKSFQGTFDGNGKTITIGYNSTDYYSNPFRYIKNATIKNLIVKGTNISSKSYVSGLVGRSYGTSVIDNCLVDVDVSTSYSSSSYIYMAGFVSDAEADVDGNLTVSNSAFTGKLGYKGTSSTALRYCGGFIGINNAASITLSNLIFAPSEIVGKYNSSMSGTLYYNYNASASVSTENCYYTVSLGVLHGTQVVTSPAEGSLVKKITVPYVETVYVAPTVEVTGIDDSYSYTGSALSISDPVVTFDSVTLTADTDYTLTVKNSSDQVVALDSVTDSDEYTIVIEGKGDYAGSIKKTFSVFKKLSGSGTEEDPFLINNVTDWKFFADSIEASSGSNETYEGKFVKLTADLGTAENPLTRWMSGASIAGNKLFMGTFDGNGKTITVNFNTDKVCTSLFGYLKNAAVKNLSIAGKITTTKWYVGSIAGITYGNITVENCKSSVEISSNYSGSGHYTGGFIGAAASNDNSGNVIFEKCAFTGKINSTKKSINLVSGFVGDGFSNGTFTCNNCLFAPEEIDLTYDEANRQRTFFTNGISNNINITNSYYTTRLAPEWVEEQGKLASKNPEDLSSFGIVSLTKKTLADDNDYYVCPDVTLENFDEVHALSGFALNISPVVKFSGITVIRGTDYTITILDSKGNEVTSVSKPGDYTLKLTGIGSYAGSQSFSFKIIGALDGVGTEESPYLIGDVVDWNNFADLVTGGTTFEGEFIKLTADIGSKENPVTKMAGTNDNAFKGIFDGNGKTLTVNYDSTELYTAPFRAITDATIKNLTVDGEITSSKKYVAGIAAYAPSNVTISDCVVKASVQTTCSDYTQKYLGGFVAWLNGGTSKTANIRNSIFCGKIKASDDKTAYYCASFVAYQGTQLKFDNCLDAPVEVAGSYSADYSHNYVGDKFSSGTPTYINCNYIVSDAGVLGNNDSSIIQAYTEIPENTNALYQRKDFTGYGTVYAAETSKFNNVSTIYDWTGSVISIDEQVTFGSTTLTRGTDYTVEILDRDGNDVTSITNSGEYTFKVTGIGDYANSMEKKFAVFRVLSCSAADEPAGTEANPYLITCVPDWNLFADRVIWGDTYQGKHVQLDSDVGTTYAPVTRMVGEANATNCFMGTFNGNGKTLTVEYEATEMNTAPFRYARKVTFKNLKIKGTIETSFNYTAGLIADLAGNSTIDNCTSSVEIKVTKNELGARPVCIGGFVASAFSTYEKLTIKDCLFDGKLLNSPDSFEPSQISGFVGYVNYDYAYFTDCLFNPAEVGTYKQDGANPFYGYSGGKSLERHCDGSVWVTAYGGTYQGKQGFISLDELPEGESADNYEQVTKCGTALYVKKSTE